MDCPVVCAQIRLLWAGGWGERGRQIGCLPRTGAATDRHGRDASPALAAEALCRRNVWMAARSAGSAAAVRAGSWDANTKVVRAAPGRAVRAKQPGGAPPGGAPPVVTAWSGCGTAGHGCAAAGPGGRSRGGRQVLLCRCCDRPCLGAAGSLEEVNDAVLAAGDALPVPLLRGLPAGPACGQGRALAVVPGGGPWIRRLADLPARVRVPRQCLGWSSEIQGACSSTIRRVA